MKKKTIYIAGDSTVATYKENQRPFVGWGEKLLEALGDVEIERYHRNNSSFENECIHVGNNYIIDNCAMPGRSSKTFREEGRLIDIDNNICEGDYLLFGFGHNDANKEKTERYVSLKDFEASILPFIEVANNHKANPVMFSSIALCPCKENMDNPSIKELDELLPQYASIMSELSNKYNLKYIDVHTISKNKLQSLSQGEIYSLYKDDYVHLVEKGALIYAKIIASNLF